MAKQGAGYIGGHQLAGRQLRSRQLHRLHLFPDQPADHRQHRPNPDHKRGEFDYIHANPPADTPGIRPGDLTVDGLPLVKPPYGRLTATNLATGTQSWQVAHGETPDYIRNHPALKGMKIPRTGMVGKIAPLTTRALVIIGDPDTYTDETGRKGARLRAYDKATARRKGAVFLPAQQSGSPMTYMLGGRHISCWRSAGEASPRSSSPCACPAAMPSRRGGGPRTSPASDGAT